MKLNNEEKEIINKASAEKEFKNYKDSSIFSCIGKNHVGIVTEWDRVNITIQEGNLDGETNTF